MTVSLNDVLLAAENLVTQIQQFQGQGSAVPTPTTTNPYTPGTNEYAVFEAAAVEVDTLEGRTAYAASIASGQTNVQATAAQAQATSTALAGGTPAEAAAAGAVAASNALPVVTTPATPSPELQNYNAAVAEAARTAAVVASTPTNDANYAADVAAADAAAVVVAAIVPVPFV